MLDQELLKERNKQAKKQLSACKLCPHLCGVNRYSGDTGVCRADARVRISGAGPHFGEEEVLVGTRGSGTIFFSFCNLRCTFCQNYEISHLGHGQLIGVQRLGDIMLQLQNRGCHNINLVSPTHYVPQIIEALSLAVVKGLKVPVVYNSGGFDSLETLTLLEGIVDIYMPDMKFFALESAKEYLGAEGYPDAVRAAVKEMHGQVGDLVLDEGGLAYRGLLVRHLVMPGHESDTREIMNFLATEISKETFVNVMGQYSPAYKAVGDARIGKRLSGKELRRAVELAREAGLHRIAY